MVRSECQRCGGTNWKYRPNGRRYCGDCNAKRQHEWRQQHPEQAREIRKRYLEKADRSGKKREWVQNNRLTIRYYSYVQSDRKRGFSDTIAKPAALQRMAEACHYCATSEAGGLDRLDSAHGHTASNVVPCCERCNVILGDLPLAIKLVFRSSLQVAAQLPEWNNWIIPTQRPHRSKS